MPTYHPCPAILSDLPPGANAVIEASAGTGKTYTIEHLVVDRLLRTSATLDQILVVTFTEKATGELRTRIRALITRVLDAGAAPIDGPAWTIDDDARATLEDALFAFDRAPIHTIHGFCHRVLYDMAFESGQLFEFEIVDGARAFNRAFREALRHTFTVDAQYRGLLRTWLDEGRDEASLERLLIDAHRKRYDESIEPIEERLPRLLGELTRAFDPGALITDLAGVAIQRAAFERAEQVIRDVATILADQPEPLVQLEALVALPLDAVLRPRRVGSRNKRRFPDDLADASKTVLDLIHRLRTTRALAASLEREVVDRFLPEVCERLRRFKRLEGQLDYDDLLIRVQAALEGDHGADLIEVLRNRYRVALIDEFQDTDDRQWDIFRRVFVESPDHQLCIIGDPKQAIYGFRGADVHTYLTARAELERRGAPRVNLATNYRSSAPLIAAVNQLLDQGAKSPLFSGEIRYDVPVDAGRADLALVDGFGEALAPVVLWRYKPPPPGPRDRQTLPKYRLQDALAPQLAASLARVFTDEGALFMRDAEGRRRVRPSDVFVLVRGHWDAVDAAAQLRAAGVPYAFYKQEGLFQTDEARDVRAVLAAVVDPHDRSARMRALATPFFGVTWAELKEFTDLPGGHPILERLYAWHQLATQERHPALFHGLLHHSGLVERALFLDETERALCNYQHIFEVLLEQIGRRRISLPETIDLIDRFIARTEMPEGADGNIQRLPDERDAVQIMTIHRAKGLEAPVVALYGGFGKARPRPVNVVHGADGQRRVLVGEAARLANEAALAKEQAEEDQRLLYVALTRAKVRLYLPYIDSTRTLTGSYGPLKERLVAMAVEGFGPEFLQIEVKDIPKWKRPPPPAPKEPMDAWRAPPQLVAVRDDAERFARLRQSAAPLLVTSYTRLKEEGYGAAAEEPAPMEPDEFKTDARAQADETLVAGTEHRLPGGRHVGRFLHEVIEELDFETFDATASMEAWSVEPAVVDVFAEVMRRHGIAARWLTTAQGLIFDTLTRAIALDDIRVEALYRCRHVVELEFLYPLPEAGHPLLGTLLEGPWTVERGFIKGFIDYVFEHEGRVYFADWKSDVLPGYDAATMNPHVAEHYELQARLYTLGVLRWLRIRDAESYARRFGGAVYVFLRGLGPGRPDGEGLWFRRPAWAEVVAWEQDLLQLGAA